MKQKYNFVLKRFKYKIPFTKLKIPCGYTLHNIDDILNKGTLVDSLLAEGFEDGQQFELIVKEI
jgi:hypothetical protein